MIRLLLVSIFLTIQLSHAKDVRDVCGITGNEYHDISLPMLRDAVAIIKKRTDSSYLNYLSYRNFGLTVNGCKDRIVYNRDYFENLYNTGINDRGGPRILRSIKTMLLSKYNINFDVIEAVVSINDSFKSMYYCNTNRDTNYTISFDYDKHEPNFGILSTILEAQILSGIIESCEAE